ncbi:unnamed protein product [Haemonchus placei]|uniref:Uncharacterized protein n=1 Tax=Haemonchus placei TaxID=6290 RepID=A0A0N4WIZ1_HAEPC|nr:unnamed protein product [Haemonchus placei]
MRVVVSRKHKRSASPRARQEDTNWLLDSAVLPASATHPSVGGEQDVNTNVGSRTKTFGADAAEDQPREAEKP